MATLESINITTTTVVEPEILTLRAPDILSSRTHQPIYFLPQSLSSSLNFHLNLPQPPYKPGAPVDRSSITNASAKTIFDITRSPLGEEWTLVNTRRTAGKDVVEARGVLEFTAGWLYGGQFRGVYSVVKDGFEVTGISSRQSPWSDDGSSVPPPTPGTPATPAGKIGGLLGLGGKGGANAEQQKITTAARDLLPTEREFTFTIQVDDLGDKNGVWKVNDGTEGADGKIIAEEVDLVQEGEEPRERLRFVSEIPMVYGFTEQEIRDFVVACWICKVWRTRNRKGWFNSSARTLTEAGNLRTW